MGCTWATYLRALQKVHDSWDFSFRRSRNHGDKFSAGSGCGSGCFRVPASLCGWRAAGWWSIGCGTLIYTLRIAILALLAVLVVLLVCCHCLMDVNIWGWELTGLTRSD
jgi:hypothetical protein